MFLFAKIVKTRGNKGEVVCSNLEYFPENLEMGSEVELIRGNFRHRYQIESQRTVNDCLLLKFQGIDTISAAYNLIGCSIYSDIEPSAEPESDESGTPDLSGWTVLNERGQMVGTVQEVLDRTLQPLLDVLGPDQREHLIPLVPEWLLEMNESSRSLTMSLPEGLLDIN